MKFGRHKKYTRITIKGERLPVIGSAQCLDEQCVS